MADHNQARRAIFDEASEIPEPEARRAFVSHACGADAVLQREVEELLAANETAGGFLADRAQGLGKLPGGSANEMTERVGRYKILQKIGEGGCGVVYMAEQTEPVRRRVALKVIKLGMDTRSVIARFEAERQALALMEHPNIAKVLDAGSTEAGRPFFVMELVRGSRITTYCDQNKLSTAERLKLFVQVCQAIQHAHQKGIIHRDIKPTNILVTVHDGLAVPKVIDFGIAKATTDLRLTDKTLFTQFELFIGTPAYMSPEQADLNAADIDTRSDIYSLGVLLYELLTGRTPFDSEVLLASGIEAMRRTIRETEPVRPSTRLRTLAAADLTQVANCRRAEPPNLLSLVRGDLDWIVLKALEKDRTRRYATANALAVDVERYLSEEPIAARPRTTLYEFQKLVRRKRLLFGAAAAIATALIAGLGVSSVLYVNEQHARKRAVAAETEQSRLREQEKRLRQDAEAVNDQLARTLFVRDWQGAETLIEQGKTSSALAWFARAVNAPHYNSTAITRLLSIMSENNFAFPLTRPMVHPGRVLDIGFSSNGRAVVTAADDGRVRIWQLGKEVEPRTLPIRFTEPLASFAPNDDRLLVLEAARLTAWTTEGTLVAEHAVHVVHRRSISVSTDGLVAALPCGERGPQLWDVAALKPLGPELPILSGELRVLLVSPDGRYLIKNSGETGLAGFAAESGKRVWERQPPDPFSLEQVVCCAMSPDGTALAAGYLQGRLAVWKFQPGAADAAAAGGEPPILDLRLGLQVKDVCFAKDGKRLYAATLDGTVHVCSLAGGDSPPQRIEHDTQLNRVRVAPDGQSIATAADDGTAQTWDVQMTLPAARIHSNGYSVFDAKYSPDGSWFIMGGSPAAEIRDAQTGALRHRLTTGGFVSLLDVSLDGHRVITASGPDRLQVWDARDGKPIGDSISVGRETTDIAFSHQGRWIAAGLTSGKVVMYEADTHKLALPPLEQLSNPVKLAFSPDDQVLVSVTEAGSVNFYELPTGTRRPCSSSHVGIVWTACFSAEGHYVVTASSDHTARLWEVATAKLIREFRHEKAVFNAAFSHDGMRLVTCSADHTARIWETRTGRPIGEPMRHPGDVWYGEFGPDDQVLLTGDDAGNARIWDAASGLPLSGWVHNGRSLKRAHLRPDGRQALSAAVDGTVRVWPVVVAPAPAPAWLVPLAEAVAGRRLTAEGTTERVPAERLRALRTELSATIGDSFYSRWARWFLTERVQENPQPFRP